MPFVECLFMAHLEVLECICYLMLAPPQEFFQMDCKADIFSKWLHIHIFCLENWLTFLIYCLNILFQCLPKEESLPPIDLRWFKVSYLFLFASLFLKTHYFLYLRYIWEIFPKFIKFFFPSRIPIRFIVFSWAFFSGLIFFP